jgi:magnesium transporter
MKLPRKLMSTTKTDNTMLRYCIAYSKGLRQANIEIDQISETLQQEDTFIWVAMHEPSEDLLKSLQREFDLHELAIEDARVAHQRPKLEQYGSSLFVVLKTASLADEHVQLGETHMFINPRFFVTIRHGPSISYTSARERLERTPQHMAKGTAMAAYVVMDFVVDNYYPILEEIKLNFEQLEADIFNGQFNRDTISRLYALKRELQLLRSAAAPVLDITDALIRLHPDLIHKDMRLYYRDIHDHVIRLVASLDEIREMLTAAMQVNLAFVTVEQNESVRRLAGWGAILAIPTVIFSLFGMNFHNMPELGWTYGYHATLLGTLLACIWLYFRLKKFGWL